MIYNDFKGIKLSALGMGCMRFPCLDGDNNKVDVETTKRMVAYAIEQGINYFDTAWIYHGGKSECVIGDILSEYPRESFYLADKFPGFEPYMMENPKELFETQLERCRVDYFDFYLFHNVCENNIDGFLDEKNGVFKYLVEQKRAGRIKHLGFSTHGSLSTIKRFLDVCGDELEFCQIQINWLDWKRQNAKAKVELVASYGIPVWVMEPVRGGRIAKLEPEYEARLKALRPDATIPEWAFRFLQSIPEVKMTLSGMSNFEQLRENIATYERTDKLTEDEMAVLFEIADAMIAKASIPCTSCRYCTDHCVQSLDIPRLIELYNERVYSSTEFLAALGLDAADESKHPSACIGCRACEQVCPQGIKISEMMRDFADRLSKNA